MMSLLRGVHRTSVLAYPERDVTDGEVTISPKPVLREQKTSEVWQEDALAGGDAPKGSAEGKPT